MAESTLNVQQQVETTLSVELGRPLPDISSESEQVEVTLVIGEVPLVAISVPVSSGSVPAHQLRVAMTKATDFDLCRAVVRHGLVGRPLTEPLTLWERLVSLTPNIIRARGKAAK